MGVSAICTSEKRTNLCRRHRESPSHHVLYALWIAMTLVSLTKGIVFKSGIPRYRCIHQVSPCFVRPQTALCSVARTPPNALSSSTGASESPSTADETRIRKPWKTLFDLELPEGRCLGLRIDAAQSQQSDALSANAIACKEHWIHSCLHQEEVQYAAAQPSEYTQQTFLLGRLAMRQVLEEEYASPILKDAHGRPNVPPNYLGSISHKRSVADGMTAVALVSPYVEGMGVGVDIELAFQGRKSIAKRVLTPNEIMELGRIEVRGVDSSDVLAFCSVAFSCLYCSFFFLLGGLKGRGSIAALQPERGFLQSDPSSHLSVRWLSRGRSDSASRRNSNCSMESQVGGS